MRHFRPISFGQQQLVAVVCAFRTSTQEASRRRLSVASMLLHDEQSSPASSSRRTQRRTQPTTLLFLTVPTWPQSDEDCHQTDQPWPHLKSADQAWHQPDCNETGNQPTTDGVAALLCMRCDNMWLSSEDVLIRRNFWHWTLTTWWRTDISTKEWAKCFRTLCTVHVNSVGRFIAHQWLMTSWEVDMQTPDLEFAAIVSLDGSWSCPEQAIGLVQHPMHSAQAVTCWSSDWQRDIDILTFRRHL